MANALSEVVQEPEPVYNLDKAFKRGCIKQATGSANYHLSLPYIVIVKGTKGGEQVPRCIT